MRLNFLNDAQGPSVVAIGIPAGDFLEQAALMEQMDFFLGIDTGPTHIAGCFDNPMVALYHCKHPGRNLMPLDHPRCAIVEHPDTDGHCPQEASMADLPMAEIHAAITQVTECPG